MLSRILIAVIVSISQHSSVAQDASWERKSVLLTSPGTKLQAPEGEKIAPKTAGVARDHAGCPGTPVPMVRAGGCADLRHRHRLGGAGLSRSCVLHVFRCSLE